MLDTDTCIHAMKGSAGFTPRVRLVDCGISVVVLGELETGVWRSQRREANRLALDHFLAAVPVVAPDTETGRRYGRLRAQLAASGDLIGPNDLWIAAHALALDLPLITHNLAEFRRVPGLTAETWLST